MKPISYANCECAHSLFFLCFFFCVFKLFLFLYQDTNTPRAAHIISLKSWVCIVFIQTNECYTYFRAHFVCMHETKLKNKSFLFRSLLCRCAHTIFRSSYRCEASKSFVRFALCILFIEWALSILWNIQACGECLWKMETY